MEFRVLGPLEVTAGGHPLAVGGARTRTVLAMLLLHVNRVVPADLLIEELWPAYPPDRAAANLQVRLSELRKALRSVGEEDRLVTRSPGYMLTATDDEVDTLRFEKLAADGEKTLAGGDTPAAVRHLNRALALWRGAALAGVEDAPLVRAEASRLEEGRLAALETAVTARLECGGHGDLIAELETLTTTHPMRETFWSQRMLALYRCGRQADALRVYRELRATLINELGIQPSVELRDLEARILRQDSTLARPSSPDSDRRGTDAPETRYVASDGVHIAYQVIGDGEFDIIAVPGLISHLDLWWEDPTAARFFRRLGSLGRLIMFDKRDTGLSDRAPGDASLEQRMDDIQAVMRACGSEKAVLLGYSEGGPMSILFAAVYPERVSALILAASAARWPSAPDYPCGRQSDEMLSALDELAASRWGKGESIEWYGPSIADIPKARQAFARWERLAVSPSALQRMLRMIRAIDVRSALAAVRVPALVIQRIDDRITPRYHGRYLVEHLPNARYFEQHGDHMLWLGDTGAMFAAIEEFLTEVDHPPDHDRVLATIVFTTVADSGAGRGLLEDIGAVTKREVAMRRGRLIYHTADGILATFDGPGRAIRSAAAVREAAAGLGIEVRVGVHTGEIELLEDGIAGLSVDIALRVATIARPAEILVSRTVKDLVIGSGISFADRGTHALSGIPDKWQLFAVGLT